MTVEKEEEKLAMPPEPELKWRNLGSPMKYRRDCPSVAIWNDPKVSTLRINLCGHSHSLSLFLKLLLWSAVSARELVCSGRVERKGSQFGGNVRFQEEGVAAVELAQCEEEQRGNLRVEDQEQQHGGDRRVEPEDDHFGGRV